MRKKPLWASMLSFTLALALLGLTSADAASFPSDTLQKNTQKAGSTESPIMRMTESMAKLLFTNLHIKKIVGDPIKVGKVTIVPIMIIDIGYGGGQGGAIQNILPGGFYFHGEAKPLGFVIISKSGSTFLSAGKAPRK